jgi:predicted neutral ceramidase superfamily lipid hydrolase
LEEVVEFELGLAFALLLLLVLLVLFARMRNTAATTITIITTIKSAIPPIKSKVLFFFFWSSFSFLTCCLGVPLLFVLAAVALMGIVSFRKEEGVFTVSCDLIL